LRFRGIYRPRSTRTHRIGTQRDSIGTCGIFTVPSKTQRQKPPTVSPKSSRPPQNRQKRRNPERRVLHGKPPTVSPASSHPQRNKQKRCHPERSRGICGWYGKALLRELHGKPSAVPPTRSRALQKRQERCHPERSRGICSSYGKALLSELHGKPFAVSRTRSRPPQKRQERCHPERSRGICSSYGKALQRVLHGKPFAQPGASTLEEQQSRWRELDRRDAAPTPRREPLRLFFLRISAKSTSASVAPISYRKLGGVNRKWPPRAPRKPTTPPPPENF
jgi:hypothetical protein